jgi:hypothetical protein
MMFTSLYLWIVDRLRKISTCFVVVLGFAFFCTFTVGIITFHDSSEYDMKGLRKTTTKINKVK